MLDPTVSFLIFTLLIPIVLFAIKLVGEKFGWKPDALAKQIIAAVLSLGAVALQVWVAGELPVFEGDSLAVLKTAVAFFSAQMAIYEVVFKRVFALFE